MYYLPWETAVLLSILSSLVSWVLMLDRTFSIVARCPTYVSVWESLRYIFRGPFYYPSVKLGQEREATPVNHCKYKTQPGGRG